MPTVSIAEAQARLPELLEQLKPGDELTITRDDRPVARVVPAPSGPEPGRPVFGRGKGKLVVWEDDDDHLKDFAEYM